MLKIFFLIGWIALTCGCTSLWMRVQTPYVQSPEVPGATLATDVQTGVAPANDVYFTDDASERPPIFNPRVERETEVPLAGSVGIAKRFSAGANFGLTGDSLSLLGKYQILGEPELTAKQGNVPLAVFARFSTASNSNRGDQDALFGPGGFPWSAQAHVDTSEVGISAGYQFASEVLAFVGYSYAKYNGAVSVSQDPSSDGSSAGGNYGSHQNGFAQSAAIGIQAGRRFYVNGELMYTNFRWQGVDPVDTGTIAFNLGWLIGGNP